MTLRNSIFSWLRSKEYCQNYAPYPIHMQDKGRKHVLDNDVAQDIDTRIQIFLFIYVPCGPRIGRRHFLDNQRNIALPDSAGHSAIVS